MACRLVQPTVMAAAAVMQLERMQSRLVKFSTSSLVKQVVVCLQLSYQPIVIELQQRMAVEADQGRVGQGMQL